MASTTWAWKARILVRTRPANRSGSLSPAASASRRARPLCPKMFESTEPSLMLAACKVFDALDVAGRLAGQLLASAGEVAQGLLGERGYEARPTRPWASKSASYVASFTSVLRPGTVNRAGFLGG